MDARVENKILRESTPLDVINYLRQQLSRIENKTLFDHLLASVSADSLPPRVVSIWLRSLADDVSVAAALRFRDSATVRKVAIQQFGKRLRSTEVSGIWHAVGATGGLLQIFAEFSVDDVDSLCRAMRRCSSTIVGKEVRRQYMSELVKALASNHFPDSSFKNPETRPLLKYYCCIVPACTEELVQEWHQKAELPRISEWDSDRKRLYEAHPAMYQSECLQTLNSHRAVDFRLRHYRMLLQSHPAIQVTKHTSASIEFALRVLRSLQANDNVKLDPREFLNDLVYPLLRRLKRHKSSTALQEEVLQLTIRWMKTETRAIEHLSLDCDLLCHAVRLWDRSLEKHEDMLQSLLKMIPAHNLSLSIVSNLLGRVYHRWQFLRLTLRNLAYFRTDIDKDEDLRKLEDAWPIEIFLSLSSQRALALLDRLIQLKPAGDFLVWSTNHIFAIDSRHDPSMLQILLLRGKDEVIKVARNAVPKRKKSANTSREQEDRAYWAKSAMFCAISSGSLDLYEETLLWARRFNKDALTVKELYSSKIVGTRDALELLSGISQHFLHPSISEADVRARVEHGNRIMTLLLETACQVLREPSFYRPDWDAVLRLFRSVTRTRLDQSTALATALRLTDQQLYDVVWQSTLETLLNAESNGLQDEHKALNFRQVDGPLRYRGAVFVQAKHHSVVFRFADELARRRNELWEIRRRTLHPAVVTLQEPWTRGLPIQSLSPLAIECCGYGRDMPSLLSRAKDIVFVDPKVALQKLPEDVETRDAIGSFVDDYTHALRFYVNSSSTTADRNRDIRLLWDYSVKQLTGNRMNNFEAVQFWKRVFRRADIQPPVSDEPMPRRPDPVLPEVDDPEEPTEWNPDPRPERWIYSFRELQSTCLDYLLEPPSRGFLEENSSFWPKQSSTVQVIQAAYWDMYTYPKKIQSSSREALIAAAIMHINSKKCAQRRVLVRPFPSVKDARYPALFLDEEFLDRKDISDDFGDVVLGRLLPDVPPSLLVRLCETMLANLQNDDNTPPVLQKATFSLLKILIESDRPHSALDLVRRIVVERPNDSSWHRTLLTIGLLNNLPAGLAKEFFLNLVSDVQAKLQQQAERNPESADKKEASAPSAPIVKVTTVKMIAQQMCHADFVDERFIVDTLVELFANTNHLDVRVAVVESLTSVLVATRDEQLQATILERLEQHAGPVASALSERKITTAEDWIKAESSGELPDVYQSSSIAMPPVLQGLFNALGRVPVALKNTMIDHILLPVMQLSARNNHQWTGLFLRVNGLDLPAGYLPLVPVKPSLLVSLIQHQIAHIPDSVLELWTSAAMVNLEPSKHLIKVNNAILNSTDLRSSDSGKHWLSLWHHEGIEALSYGRPLISTLLDTSFESHVSGGITRGQVQAVILKLAKALIMRSDPTCRELEYLLNFLQPRIHQNERLQNLWRENCRPLIESTISFIDGLRTIRWNCDPDRKPDVLIDTYKYNLWLLTLPSMPWTTDHQVRLGTYAGELIGGIESLAADSTEPYHHRYQQLKTFALGMWPVDFCYLACRLGTLDRVRNGDLNCADLLGIELADEFLQAAEQPKEASLAQDARNLLASWRSCEAESIRMRGLRTTRIVSGQKYGKKAWFVGK